MGGMASESNARQAVLPRVSFGTARLWGASSGRIASARLTCLFFCLVMLGLCSAVLAQGPASNVILVTLDGLRPEEVFGGADERLFLADLGVKDAAEAKEQYGGETPEVRRRKLMPFLWDRIDREKGWIAGDVEQDSLVQVSNGRYFSYPGYSEILCGFPDDKIDSNDKKNNENRTVLEYLNDSPEYIGFVEAYCSWDVFPYIINSDRSGIPVNAGWAPLQTGEPRRLALLNRVADNIVHEWDGVRYDVFTAAGAIESMMTNQPKVLYVALGETDDWAHAGRYDRYLLAAQQNDRMLRELWLASNSIKEYRQKTIFIVTTDHGRGDGREGWKNHSSKLPGSERVWIAAYGAGLGRTGMDRGGSYTQAQVAATVAGFVGFDLQAQNERVAPPLPIIKTP